MYGAVVSIEGTERKSALFRCTQMPRTPARSSTVRGCTRRSSGISRSCTVPIGWRSFAATYRIGSNTWARLIHNIYEVDPLECARCKGPMRVIALIDDAAVIRKILGHLGLWAPQQAPRRQPGRVRP